MAFCPGVLSTATCNFHKIDCGCCVRLHRQFTATRACIVLAFALGDQCAVDKPPLVDEVHPNVLIRGKKFFVAEHYHKDASGRLQYDKKLIEELDMKTTGVLRNMCKHNPPSAQPTYKDKKGGPHLQACILRFLRKHTCVHPFMYICI